MFNLFNQNKKDPLDCSNWKDPLDCSNWKDAIEYVMNTNKQFIHRNCTLDKAVGSKPIAITPRNNHGISDYYTQIDAIDYLNAFIEF